MQGMKEVKVNHCPERLVPVSELRSMVSVWLFHGRVLLAAVSGGSWGSGNEGVRT